MSYTQCVKNGQPMYYSDPSGGEFPTICEACKCGENVSCLPGSDGMGGAPAWASLVACGDTSACSCSPSPSGGGDSNYIDWCAQSHFGWANPQAAPVSCRTDLANCCEAKCIQAGYTQPGNTCYEDCDADAYDWCTSMPDPGPNPPGPNPPGPNPPGPNPPQPTPPQPTPPRRLGSQQQSQSFLEQPAGKAAAVGMSIFIPLLIAWLLMIIMKMK